MSATQTTTDAHATGDASAASTKPSYDDINVGVVLLIGVISAVLTLFVIWFVEGLYYRWESSLVRERNYDVTNPRQVDTLNAQKALVTQGDAEQGIASLASVADAVVEQYKHAESSSEGGAAAHGDDHGGDASHADEGGGGHDGEAADGG